MFETDVTKRLVKFNPERVKGDVPHIHEIEEMILWGKILDSLLNFCDFAPRSGNLSVRHGEGMIITNSGADLRQLTPSDFSFVKSMDPQRQIVYFCGQPGVSPSSETRIHYRIYQARKEIKAVFHVHDHFSLAIAGRLGIPVTARYEPLGSTQLVKQVLTLLSKEKGAKLIGWKDHGICSLGTSVYEAAWLIATTHLKAREIQV